MHPGVRRPGWRVRLCAVCRLVRAELKACRTVGSYSTANSDLYDRRETLNCQRIGKQERTNAPATAMPKTAQDPNPIPPTMRRIFSRRKLQCTCHLDDAKNITCCSDAFGNKSQARALVRICPTIAAQREVIHAANPCSALCVDSKRIIWNSGQRGRSRRRHAQSVYAAFPGRWLQCSLHCAARGRISLPPNDRKALGGVVFIPTVGGCSCALQLLASPACSTGVAFRKLMSCAF